MRCFWPSRTYVPPYIYTPPRLAFVAAEGVRACVIQPGGGKVGTKRCFQLRTYMVLDIRFLWSQAKRAHSTLFLKNNTWYSYRRTKCKNDPRLIPGNVLKKTGERVLKRFTFLIFRTILGRCSTDEPPSQTTISCRSPRQTPPPSSIMCVDCGLMTTLFFVFSYFEDS